MFPRLTSTWNRPPGVWLQNLRQADPASHQPRIDKKAEHSLGPGRDEDLPRYNAWAAGHRMLPFLSAASAASLSWARWSSQKAPSSARSRATAGRLAR